MKNGIDTVHSLRQLFSSSEEEQRRIAVASLIKLSFSDIREMLYEAMGDESWRVRKEALEVLYRYPIEDRVIEDMVGLLRASDNAGLRNSACEALEKFGEKSVPVLSRYIDDEDHDVRKFVIDVLGNIGSQEPVPLLIRALRDEDPNVSSAAAENLGKIGDPRAVPELVAVLDRGNISLCYTVLEALGRIGKPVPVETVIALADESLLKKPLIDCLGAIGDVEVVPFLIDGLREKAKHVRAAAASSLLMIREGLSRELAHEKIDAQLRGFAGTDFAREFISAITETEKHLSEPLIRILGLLGDPAAAMLLLEGCRDDRLRGGCLNSFREIGAEGLHALIRAYPESDDEQKCYITYICGELGCPESANILREGMKSRSHMLRRVAVIAAGNIGSAEIIPDIEPLLDDDELDVRVGAVEALGRLVDKDRIAVERIAADLSTSPVPEKRRSSTSLYAALRSTERLARLIKDEDANVRTAAVFSLAELKDPASVNHLVMALVDEEPNVRMAVAGALGEFGGDFVVQPLMLALKDQNQWVKCAALRSLGALRVADAEPAISELVANSEGIVLIAALKTMLEINGESAKRLCIKALEHGDSEIVKAAVEILIHIDDSWLDDQSDRLLFHDQWDIRSIFIKALAEYRGAKALPLLKAALERETDDLVRRQLTDLLGEFT
ncbi:phycocyanobilin lyase subunit alpha [Geobacter sp. OR-1]|uniref:HEAT repeat domain-containing protein n=1 Tax=Geobacter sp. OR-1 TaxID=1266765 RepID=UPI0005443D3B|nr:HEAT repeat domain-containing protein [Geobacter sp. OR-1]GAM08186.1 phycocyanobilin lyase subunit alpha [Geobacter sp. OR-1]